MTTYATGPVPAPGGDGPPEPLEAAAQRGLDPARHTFATPAAELRAALRALPLDPRTGAAGRAAQLMAVASAAPAAAARLAGHLAVLRAVAEHGDDAQRAAWLDPLAGLELLAGCRLAEPCGSDDPADAGLVAERQGTQPRDRSRRSAPTGERAASYIIHDASEPDGAADVRLVFASVRAGAVAAFLVDPATARSGDVLRVPLAARLQGHGERVAASVLPALRIDLAACAVGAGDLALGRTTAYVHGRATAGGSTLARREEVRFPIADMAAELAAARALVTHAAAALDDGDADALRFLAPAAKRVACDAAAGVVTGALAVHGAFGHRPGYGLREAGRDVEAIRAAAGGTGALRFDLARHVLDGAA
jgi:alkylation response protein AidB-like acyl-CoA dehydrogenase